MIALVTGANRGIGQETVRQLALHHTVYLGSRDLDKGEAARMELGAPANVKVISLDVREDSSISQALTRIYEEHGRLDVLINNAAINYDTYHNALNADLENVRETFETNIFGAWSMLQRVIPAMMEKGYGRIVNVSSGLGALGTMSTSSPGYSLSKSALNVLTIQMAQLTAGHDVLINAVSPGWVRTDMGGPEAPRSVKEGAETIVWAAQLPSGGPNGKFFRDKKPIAF